MEERFNSSPNQVIAAKTNILNLIVLRARHSIASLRFEGIIDIARSFITMLKPLSKLRKILLTEELVTVISIEEGSTYGSIGISCAKAEEAEGRLDSDDVQTYKAKVKKAVKSVTDVELDKIAAFDKYTRYVLVNLIHMCIAVNAWNHISLEKLFGNLSDKTKTQELYYASAELAKVVNPHLDIDLEDGASVLTFVEHKTVLSFARDSVGPALCNANLQEKGISMMGNMRKYITEVKSRQRKEDILPAFEKAEAISIVGGNINDATVYCSGTGKECNDRRSQMNRLILNLMASEACRAKLPGGVFEDEYEYANYHLINSPKVVNDTCNFSPEFLRGDVERVTKVTTAIKAQKQRRHLINFDGTKTIVVEDVAQIEAAKALLRYE